MSACATCGEPLQPEHRFCPTCGTAAAGTEREARKVVSALFCDVVGSTALGERLDPEDFTALVGEAVARMARAVEEFGGSVVELSGDGLLALFGAPVAHEDDAERAVRAGLRILAAIDEYGPEVRARWPVEGIAVRVGIETGLAVLGPLGAGRKVEYSAMGDALNTAARLQAAAEPGTVLAGERTQRAAASAFRWGPARELELKGKAGKVVAYPVEGLPEGPDVRAPVGAPLVGRDRELAAAEEAVVAVAGGAGGAVFVFGEGGIGKSRLVGELEARFGDQSLWLRARCASYGEHVPYQPVRALLLEWLRHEGDGPPAGRLRAACRELLGDAAAAAEPFLLALIDETEATPDLAPEGVHERTLNALATLLSALSTRGPLVVWIDDLHWADPSTLELLDSLLELTDDAALLLVLSARPERDHGCWQLRERALRVLPHRTGDLSLEALDADDGRTLLEALVGRGALPAALERRILERAEGNPFYLEEIVRSLRDAGALERTPDGWRARLDVPVEVPDTVEKLLLARIDRLDSESHAVLSAAAVLGRQFELPVLERVAGCEPGAALRELQRLELVRQGRRWPVPEYRFRHSLIQEAAYRALLRRRRRELHRRAAEAIRAVHGSGDEQAGVLARHLHEAGELDEAFALHQRAARAAQRIHAQEEALEQLDGALSAAAALGRGPEDPDVRRLYLLRGSIRHGAIGDYEGGRADCETAAGAARAAGDPQLEVEALLSLCTAQRASDWPAAVEASAGAVAAARASGDASLLVNALARHSILHANLLRLDVAQELGEDALEVATSTGLVWDRIHALDALKLAALLLGDLTRLDAICRELLDRLAAAPRTAAEIALAPDVYRAWTLEESAFVSAAAGRWEEAEARVEEAIATMQRFGYVTHLIAFFDARARVLRSRGALDAALASADDGAERARRSANREWEAWVGATAGWVLLDLARPDDARARLERARDLAVDSGAPMPQVRAAGLLARAHVARDDGAAARAAADDVERLLARASFPSGGAFLYGAHAIAGAAEALVHVGEPERARRLAEPALAAARRAGWSEVEAELSAAAHAASQPA